MKVGTSNQLDENLETLKSLGIQEDIPQIDFGIFKFTASLLESSKQQQLQEDLEAQISPLNIEIQLDEIKGELNQQKILIVDDNEFNLFTLKEILS